jgi:myo-inositol-1(or 4)-monophosphatase
MLNQKQIQQIEKTIRRAGASLMENFKKPMAWQNKSIEGDVVTKADLEAEKIIISDLEKIFPKHNIITEEHGEIKKIKSDYLWLIDPLDGSRNFLRGIPIFGSSIALIHKNKVIFGMVFLPHQNELFFAKKERGAYLNERKIHVSEKQKLEEMIIGLTFLRHRFEPKKYLPILNRISNYTDWTLEFSAVVPMLCYTACGRLDAMISAGVWPWDHAACGLIFQEAGGKVTNLQGEKWNWQEPVQNIVAANPKLHSQIMEKIIK